MKDFNRALGELFIKYRIRSTRDAVFTAVIGVDN